MPGQGSPPNTESVTGKEQEGSRPHLRMKEQVYMWEQDRSPSVQQSLSLVLNAIIAPGGVTRGVTHLRERVHR